MQIWLHSQFIYRKQTDINVVLSIAYASGAMYKNMNGPNLKKSILKISFIVVSLTLVLGVAYGSMEMILKKRFVKPYDPGLLTNWQTYLNDKWGFSIQYPKGWLVIEKENDNEYLKKFPFSEQDQSRYEGIAVPPPAVEFKPPEPHKSPTITVLLYDNPKKLSVSGWAQWYYEVENNPTYSIININGNDGLRKDTTPKNGGAFFSNVISTKDIRAFEFQFFWLTPGQLNKEKSILHSPEECKIFWDKMLNTIEID